CRSIATSSSRSISTRARFRLANTLRLTKSFRMAGWVSISAQPQSSSSAPRSRAPGPFSGTDRWAYSKSKIAPRARSPLPKRLPQTRRPSASSAAAIRSKRSRKQGWRTKSPSSPPAAEPAWNCSKAKTCPEWPLFPRHQHKPPNERNNMPVADFKTYCAILDRARAGRFALPAVNVTSLTTANAVLRGLAESKADGIVQVSTGGGAFASGGAVKDMALGATSIAEHVHHVADRYPIYVALSTDHCLKDKLEKFVLPLVEETEKRRAEGRPNLFSAHMFDGSNLPLKQNLDIAASLLERFAKNDLVLEIETGAVGGEEDDVKGDK